MGTVGAPAGRVDAVDALQGDFPTLPFDGREKARIIGRTRTSLPRDGFGARVKGALSMSKGGIEG